MLPYGRLEETHSPGKGKFPVPPSPSGSTEGATAEKNPETTAIPPAEALAEQSPVSTVQVLSSREGTLSATRGDVEPVVGAKPEVATAQPSPSTPRTEEASPAGGSAATVTITPVRTSLRKATVGPFAFAPEAPMLVLPLVGLSAAGCFPNYQTAMSNGALVPYDSLDRNSTFVVFVSHRWVSRSADDSAVEASFRQEGERGGGGVGGDAGTPDVDSTKHALLVEGLRLILASLPREVTVFLWVDYSCIDQVKRVSGKKITWSIIGQRKDRRDNGM